jgi:hypothetical protein
MVTSLTVLQAFYFMVSKLSCDVERICDVISVSQSLLNFYSAELSSNKI